VYIGDREIERRVFDTTAITIGRAPGNDIRLDNPAVSSLHARIVRRAAGYVLEDLQSTNGTYLNGRRVTSEVIVGSPRVTIGKHVLHLYEEGESAGDAGASASSPLAGAEATMFLETASARAMRAGSGGETPGGAPGLATLVLEGGKGSPSTLLLADAKTRVGKGAGAELRLGGWFTPDLAFTVERTSAGYALLPAGRGTVRLNGRPAGDRVPLRAGDLIEASGASFRFTYSGGRA
jgi:hypothetical protein